MTELECRKEVFDFYKRNKRDENIYQKMYQKIDEIYKREEGNILINSLKIYCQKEIKVISLFNSLFTLANTGITIINIIGAADIYGKAMFIFFIFLVVGVAFVYISYKLEKYNFIKEVINQYE
ncbi:MAG: hypothetical protein KH355_03140 [Clostridiales bacterium]|nr:hypothetical protein [Clostridiales bacterium]